MKREKISHPQEDIGGAVSLQTTGRVEALVTFNLKPLFFKPWHRHSAFASSTFLRPEQHEASGFSTVLPIVTKDKQLAMFSITVEQSTAGAGFP